MINFFDKYRDLFQVDNHTIIPTARLTPQHPLFNGESYSPLKQFTFNSRPIDITKQLDTFQSKLQNYKKHKSKEHRSKIQSPLKLEEYGYGYEYDRRPSSRKKSIIKSKSSLNAQLEKLNEIEDMLFVESNDNLSGIQSPLIRKVSSHEVPNEVANKGKWQTNKQNLLKKRLSSKSQIPVTITSPTKQTQQATQSKAKWTIEQMKSHKPTISTNAFAQHRRGQAQRNLRARQNKLRTILFSKY